MANGPTIAEYLAKARLKDKAGDWLYAQAQYEQGVKSVPDIAKDVGASTAAIASRAVRERWVRDPAARLRIDEERRAADTSIYRKELAKQKDEVIRVTAHMQSKILVGHRADIKQARRLAVHLMNELEAMTSGIEEFKNLGVFLNAPDDRGIDKLNNLYKRVISLPERSATLNSLGSVLKTLIQLERQAFSITGMIEDPEQARAPEEVTKGLNDIMAKFDSVLAMQVPEALAPQTLEVIVDVSRTHQAATT
jgi:hydrogenase maturation factor HypF (carbamoyltransferase family)